MFSVLEDSTLPDYEEEQIGSDLSSQNWAA